MQHYEEQHQDIFPISPVVPLIPITCVPLFTHNTRSKQPILDASHSIRIHVSSSSNSSRPGTPDINDSQTCNPTDIYDPRTSNQMSDPDCTDTDTDDCVPQKKRVRTSRPTKDESDTQSDDTTFRLRKHTERPTPPSTPIIPKVREPKKCHLSTICPITGVKKFICKVQTCLKQYKNANGLKVTPEAYI